MKFVVIDDDPTGSQTVHDCLLLLKWDYSTLVKGFESESNLFFILANTRSLSENDAKFTIKEICKNPTIVLSGINNGYNLSRNIMISGTIGAAMIANTQGKKSIAFSSESFESIHNHHLQMMINRIVKECISENIPNEIFLNINFPNAKDEKIGHAIETGPENSNLSITTDQVSKNEYKILLSQLQPQKSNNSKDKTDMKTVKNGLVSITLLNGNNFSQHKSKNTIERILKAANT